MSTFKIYIERTAPVVNAGYVCPDGTDIVSASAAGKFDLTTVSAILGTMEPVGLKKVELFAAPVTEVDSDTQCRIDHAKKFVAEMDRTRLADAKATLSEGGSLKGMLALGRLSGAEYRAITYLHATDNLV